MISLTSFSWLTVALTYFVLVDYASGADTGSLTCTNGAWVPDAKLIGFGLSCPLSLDGKDKSKGKTTVCAFKKVGLYDGKSAKKDKIAGELCPVFKPDTLAAECKKAVANCLKNGKGYFQDPKTDTEYKSWAQPYGCMEKWITGACKK